eukprot:6002105-Amphidinium_carterae.2
MTASQRVLHRALVSVLWYRDSYSRNAVPRPSSWSGVLPQALKLSGLMTIGAPDYSDCRTEVRELHLAKATSPIIDCAGRLLRDFELLRSTRREVAARLEVSPEELLMD